MKATVLLGTLKRTGLSNTETLCEFLTRRLEGSGVSCEIIKLVDHAILPGTYSNMGPGDEWPPILETLIASDIIIFATPVWWDNQSSLIQQAVERLDELHDMIMEGKASPLEGKTGGIVVTGDSDGSQHIIGNLANFFNAIGLVLLPFATLTVLSPLQAKGADTTKEALLRMYEKDYGSAADRMIRQLLEYARRSHA
jgi:multimeric flavodoxin WrbA